MLQAVFISRGTLFIILAIIAVILLIANPKMLWTIIRYGIFLLVCTLVFVIKNVANIFEWAIGQFFSNRSWAYELFDGIISISIDTAVVFVIGLIILPKKQISMIIVAVGGALYCLRNLFRYQLFSFFPMGWDPAVEHHINWPFNLIYMAIFGCIAWFFTSREKEEITERKTIVG